jgi:hypothetical protein
MMTDQPTDGMEIVELASAAMTRLTSADTSDYTEVVVPHVSIDTEVDVAWLKGLVTGAGPLQEVFQLLRLRMDETGAQVQVASGMMARGGPTPLRFDQPFVGWFTQPNSSVPLAAFYADEQTWVNDD